MTAERIPFLADLSADFRTLYHANNIANDFLLRSPGGIYSSNLASTLNTTLPTQQTLPEKITSFCISSKGIRYYKIQWQESWLAEPLLIQFQNHQSLLESYWSKVSQSSTNTLPKQTPLAVPEEPPKKKKQSQLKSAFSQSTTKLLPIQITESETPNTSSISDGFTHKPLQNISTPSETISFGIETSKSIPSTYSSATTLQELTESLHLPNDPILSSTNYNNDGASTADTAIDITDINLPIESPVKSKVNSLSQFSTLGTSSRNRKKISIHMDNFDLVNIENFNVSEEELKATAIETLSSFKRKRMRFPNGTSKLPQTCFFCLKVISNRKQLREHQFTTHFKNVGDFSCPICSKLFIYRQQLRDHMISHTDERQFQCKICGLTCKRKSHLQKHMSTHNKEKNYRCDVCHENFKVQAELKTHCLTAHKNQVVQCNVCKYTLHTANSVYMHSLRHSGTRDHICQICGAGFKLKQHLIGHMSVHSKEKEMFQCPGCPKQFPDKKSLKKHLEQHHEDIATNYRYDYKCETCGKEFAYKGRYEEHVKSHESETEEERNVRELKARVSSLSDDIIEKEFTNFEKVQGVDETDIKLRCKLCKNREFRMVSVARRHDNDHKEGKIIAILFTCHICGEVFRSKIKFKRHRQTHEKPTSTIAKKNTATVKSRSRINKQMQCKRCMQTFKWKSLLQSHLTKCGAQEHNSKGSTRRKATLKAIEKMVEISNDVSSDDDNDNLELNNFTNIKIKESNQDTNTIAESFSSTQPSNKSDIENASKIEIKVPPSLHSNIEQTPSNQTTEEQEAVSANDEQGLMLPLTIDV